MKRATRFGPQPIRETLLRRNISVRDFAASIDIAYQHAARANAGRLAPAPIYVERAAKRLRMTATELFTRDALDAIYMGHINKSFPADLRLRGGDR